MSTWIAWWVSGWWMALYMREKDVEKKENFSTKLKKWLVTTDLKIGAWQMLSAGDSLLPWLEAEILKELKELYQQIESFEDAFSLWKIAWPFLRDVDLDDADSSFINQIRDKLIEKTVNFKRHLCEILKACDDHPRDIWRDMEQSGISKDSPHDWWYELSCYDMEDVSEEFYELAHHGMEITSVDN